MVEYPEPLVLDTLVLDNLEYLELLESLEFLEYLESLESLAPQKRNQKTNEDIQ